MNGLRAGMSAPPLMAAAQAAAGVKSLTCQEATFYRASPEPPQSTQLRHCPHAPGASAT